MLFYENTIGKTKVLVFFSFILVLGLISLWVNHFRFYLLLVFKIFFF